MKTKPIICYGIKDKETNQIEIWAFSHHKKALHDINTKFYRIIKVKISEVKNAKKV